MSKPRSLGRREVEHLSEAWGNDRLWRDVLALADRFWESEGDLRLDSWHHLLLAVGNFKRQARVEPPTLPRTRSPRRLKTFHGAKR